jgi:hypothetical protein
MTSLLCAHCLPAGPFRTGNRTGARVRSFDLGKEARQMAKFAKTTANCSKFFLSLSFNLIRESASTAFDFNIL